MDSKLKWSLFFLLVLGLSTGFTWSNANAVSQNDDSKLIACDGDDGDDDNSVACDGDDGDDDDSFACGGDDDGDDDDSVIG